MSNGAHRERKARIHNQVIANRQIEGRGPENPCREQVCFVQHHKQTRKSEKRVSREAIFFSSVSYSICLLTGARNPYTSAEVHRIYRPRQFLSNEKMASIFHTELQIAYSSIKEAPSILTPLH